MFIEDDSHSERQETIETILRAAMENAAESLEKVIGSEVKIISPKIYWVNKNNLVDTLSELNLPEKSTVIRQSIRGQLRGENLIIWEHGAKHYQLGHALGYEGEISALNVQELTLEVANIISGACINGLSNQLNITLNFNAPSLLTKQSSLPKWLVGKKTEWTDALFMAIGFNVSNIGMNGQLIICMVEEDSHELYRHIDSQLEIV